MSQMTGVVVFEGGVLCSCLEREMHKIRNMLTIELLKKCLADPIIGPVILVTNYEDLIEETRELPIEIFNTKKICSFHFGNILNHVCKMHRLKKVIAFSGASAPLMKREELALISQVVTERDNIVVSNNPQSADLVAFSPVSVMDSVELPDIDNPFPWILKEEGKLTPYLLPITPGFNFDLDTPLDLVYLSFHSQCPESVIEMTEPWAPIYERIARARDVVTTPNAEVLLAGRVGPWIMTYMNEKVRCRLRVVSEERGMKALGRAERGEVYTILGAMIDMMGLKGFFHYIEEYCQTAFIDTRVLFAHWKIEPDSDDRFYSDLGEYRRIKNPVVRDLTRLASECGIPVILGGHNVVSGGMMVLLDGVNRKI